MNKKHLLVLIMLVKFSIVGAQNYPTYVPSNGLVLIDKVRNSI